MLAFLLWYFLISLLGLLAFPLAYRWLPALPGQGYAFSRALGLLLWGYGFWLLGSFGFLPNTLGGGLLALGGVVAASAWALSRMDREGLAALLGWFREWRVHVLVTEALFLAAFAGWAFVRASNPEISATEKPMELAFINAITRSPSFPPFDPWLSGYAISYYYFGYVLTALLATATTTPTGVAFNLAVALVFALSALGAYGLVFNLLALRKTWRASLSTSLYALLAPLYVLIASNVEGFLEVLHARGLFWAATPEGGFTSRFWPWLDMKELVQPPALPFQWMPTRYLWWWRASRVVQDYDFAGNFREVIDEFPFFSFLLADLHPHVLALPFAFLAAALALNLFQGGAGIMSPPKPALRSTEGLGGGVGLLLRAEAFWLAAAVLGGLAFLNTWDFPIYVGLFAGADAVRRAQQAGWGWHILREFLLLGLALGVAGVGLYFPFYIGFSSQAGGILPNLLNPTRGAHLWVMFGTLLVPICGLLMLALRKGAGSLWRGLAWAFGLTGFLWAFSLLLGWAISALPAIGDLPVLGNLFLDLQGAPGRGPLFSEAFTRRFWASGGWLTLTLVIAFALAALFDAVQPAAEGEDARRKFSPFPFLLVLVGALLVLAPEFFYLRDQFGSRMNTIFKFYYQAWLLWGVAAAFGTAVLFREGKGAGASILKGAVVAALAVGLVYPVFSLQTKTNGFKPAAGFTLDGTLSDGYLTPDDAAAVAWLKTAPVGPLVEAVGGSYSGFARISAHSGMPAVLGWPGHESQWRGGSLEMGSRQIDIQQLYASPSWKEAEDIIARYGIRYIYVGPLERATYRVQETKFQQFLTLAFQQGQVTIYKVP